VTDRFQTFEIDSRLQLDLPLTRVIGCSGLLEMPGIGTQFVLVAEGEAVCESADRPAVRLIGGMFCVAPGRTRLDATAGRVLVITQLGYEGVWQVGGPPEALGRLRYIDGCSDTLLVCPPRLGEPCLNHLHIPPGTNQTAHTHPSVRIGTIARGEGECRVGDHRYPLWPGMGWLIPEAVLHSFHTAGSSLDVIAWHPDSDFGPTDECHPMRNRTIL